MVSLPQTQIEQDFLSSSALMLIVIAVEKSFTEKENDEITWHMKSTQQQAEKYLRCSLSRSFLACVFCPTCSCAVCGNEWYAV